MLSYSDIERNTRNATNAAKRRNLKPLLAREFDASRPNDFLRRIPSLGNFVPEGWQVAEGIQDYFVAATELDKSGPALSLERFAGIVENFRRSGDPYAFGIVEAGEFQVIIRVYRPDRRDFTRTGALTNQELDSLRHRKYR